MIIKVYKLEEKWCFDYHCQKYIIQDPDNVLSKLSEFFNFSTIYLTVKFYFYGSLGYFIKNGCNFYTGGHINTLLDLLKIRYISGDIGRKIRIYEPSSEFKTFFITKINKIIL